jgi:hypothetical protein
MSEHVPNQSGEGLRFSAYPLQEFTVDAIPVTDQSIAATRKGRPQPPHDVDEETLEDLSSDESK